MSDCKKFADALTSRLNDLAKHSENADELSDKMHDLMISRTFKRTIASSKLPWKDMEKDDISMSLSNLDQLKTSWFF